jgi:chemosensory pili system protein ChpA (sensor histidine kinase/response regulator)
VHYLPRLFDDPVAAPAGPAHSSLVLLQGRTGRVAVHVDRVLGDAEYVVKSVGPQLACLPWVSGGTVLSDGRVVLIVNPLPLVQRAAASAAVPVIEREEITLPEVMVVDDSLTVRTITGRLLAREGYQVVTAKDGVDALEQLATLTPRLMVVDLEMPRMDGFDLIRNVRAMPRLARVPIVVVTSRTADKHRSLALSLGADVFLGKPYQEDALLGYVRELIARDPAAGGRAHAGDATHAAVPLSEAVLGAA